MIIHNASFIINQLAEEFKGELLGISSNAFREIWKNISLFLCQLRKNVVEVKQLQVK